MMGKVLAIGIALTALVAGVSMYYLHTSAFYEELEAQGDADVMMTARASDLPEAVAHAGFQGIDSDSSPIRYRACFTTDLSAETLRATYKPAENAVPLLAPKWFDCFDAKEVGAALEDGTAMAFMGTENVRYGIDRIVAILDDGRGFVWQQINHCGEIVFDGQPAPDDCPEPPERYQ